MIDIDFQELNVTSGHGHVNVFVRADGPDEAIRLPVSLFIGDVTVLEQAENPLDFDAAELTLRVGTAKLGGHWKKHDDVAGLLATLIYAANFAGEATAAAAAADPVATDLGLILRARETVQATRVQLLADLQERHIRARLARMFGVKPQALTGFESGPSRRTRSGLSGTLHGLIDGQAVAFALEYEHLLLYVAQAPARRVTRYEEVVSALLATRPAGSHPAVRTGQLRAG